MVFRAQGESPRPDLGESEPRHRGESCDEGCSVRENLRNDNS